MYRTWSKRTHGSLNWSLIDFVKLIWTRLHMCAAQCIEKQKENNQDQPYGTFKTQFIVFLDFFCQLLNFLLKKCSAVSRDSRTLPLTLIISLSLSHSLLRLCWDSAQTCHRLSETLQHTLLISNLFCHRLCHSLCYRFCTDPAHPFFRICSDSVQTC